MGIDEEFGCGCAKSEVFRGHLSEDGGQAVLGMYVQGSGEQVRLEMKMWGLCTGMVFHASRLHGITCLPNDFSLPELYFLSLQVYRFMSFSLKVIPSVSGRPMGCVCSSVRFTTQHLVPSSLNGSC